MAKYLYKGRYTQEGINGFIVHGGGSARRKAVQDLAASLGGSLESFYFAFGSNDFYVVVDLPDHASAAAGALIFGSSGTVSAETVVLLEAEDMDAASAKHPAYRAPDESWVMGDGVTSGGLTRHCDGP